MISKATPRYTTGDVAIEFKEDVNDSIIARAQRLIANDGLYLVHVVSLEACHTDHGFEPACMEQEYWRCEEQLRAVGNRFDIPPQRQVLIVGSIQEQIANFIERAKIELLILGATNDEDIEYPIDVICGALLRTHCDLLTVRTAKP